MRLLIPVDGSEHSKRALEHAIKLAQCAEPPEIHLLHVRPPVDAWEVRHFLNDEEIAELQQKEGEAGLRESCAMLTAAGVRHVPRVAIGPIAETVASYADEQGCDSIVMGTHGRGDLSRLLMGSVASEVVRLAKVPVTLVK